MPSRDEIATRARQIVAEHYQSNGLPHPEIGDDFPLIGGGTHLGDDAVGDLDSLDHVEIVMSLEDAFEIEIPDDAAEQLKTFGDLVGFLAKQPGVIEAMAEDEPDEERCIACDIAFKEGDMVLDDISGGALHVACCGPEREGYVKDLDSGEPLGPDDPIPTGYAWSKPLPAEAA